MAAALFFFLLDNLAPAVVPAFRANLVGDLVLAAAIAGHQVLETQGIVGAAAVLACL
jgi:hypothetical protein